MLPKSVTPSRVEENLKSKSSHLDYMRLYSLTLPAFELPEDMFNRLEEAATSHPPQRVVNPSQGWKLGFDVFDEDWPL